MENYDRLHDRFDLAIGYKGLIATDSEGTRVYGWDSVKVPSAAGPALTKRDMGGCFGVVQAGRVDIEWQGEMIALRPGTWFTTRDGFSGIVHRQSRVAVFQRIGYEGVDSLGQIHASSQGDLKYIDGCRDSVLVAPRVMGHPVLNALYVPAGVHQTMHVHPSTRAGIIMSSDEAQCDTPSAKYPLVPGAIFFLPRNGQHKFRTDLGSKFARIHLVAYHPDSDFGPTDEEHPMINRTYLDEKTPWSKRKLPAEE